ncbi:MAG: SdpI family protein [Lachnospiraceae bacterium]|nr:SdpI family protein [Lachnospiraceae bacterium]MDD7078875.1 SdpI family protein [Lachnospiraceae bacterium]
MKKYKKRIIISSVITLLPILAGLILWNRLPDTIATHFGNDNVANGWSSKPFVVFAMPLLLLGLHLFILFVTMNDPKRKNISEKMFGFLIWFVPVLSVFIFSITYCNALGMNVNIGMAVNIIVGIVFLVIGNYLPKCKQNYTAGIRIPWTLNSTENWNRTHRLAGWLFMLGGILFFLNAFLQWSGMFFVIIVIALLPEVYSFLLYKKGI